MCRYCRLNQLYVLNHDSKKSIYNIANSDSSKTSEEMASISESDRTLRIISLWLWVPSFALLLAYGISARQFVLPLGNIPMTFSVFSTLIHLAPKSANPHGSRKIRDGLSVFSDLVIALLYIGLLIPAWIILASGWNGNNKMLGSYATMPMMVNFCIHAYFVLRSVGYSWLFETKTCPHCNGDLGVKKPRGRSERSSSSKESYLPVNMMDAVAEREANAGLESSDYRAPSASTDDGRDENERLIRAE